MNKKDFKEIIRKRIRTVEANCNMGILIRKVVVKELEKLLDDLDD